MTSYLSETVNLVAQLEDIMFGTLPNGVGANSTKPTRLASGMVSTHLGVMEDLNDRLRTIIREAQLLK